MATKYWDRNIKLKRYITGGVNSQSSTSLEIISKNDIQYIKISEYSFEQHNTAEIIIENFTKEEFVLFDRMALEDDYFNWYIISDNVRLTDLGNKIYEHTLTLIDLSYKLVNFPVSNLSFNNLINKKIFNTMFDIFKRIYELTPFESGDYIYKTRPTYSNTMYDINLDLDIATSEEIRLNYGLTLNLYNKLISYKNPKEINFSGKNLHEVYTEMFSILGGIPKVIHDDDGEAMLDIRYYYDHNHQVVNMMDYMGYTSTNESKLYATGVEINSDNIVDENSLFTSGQTYGKVFTTDEIIIGEDKAYIELEVPIYEMVKAECSKLDNPYVTTDWIDITQYTASDQEFAFLLNESSGLDKHPTVRNSTQYKLGGTRVTGWGKEYTSDGALVIYSTWDEMITDAGGDTSAPYEKLTQWKFRYTYKPFILNNRFNIKKGTVNKNNKNATIRINEGDRINEFEKLIQSSRNKLDRSEPGKTSKYYDHLSSEDIYKLGSYDTDSKLYISTVITEYTTEEINTEYILSNIKNRISELTGVNTENRFTDISKNIRRNETVDEYMYWSKEQLTGSSNIFDTVFITRAGMDHIYYDFTRRSISDLRERRFFIFTPEGVLDAASEQLNYALPVINISGNSILGYRTPIEHPLKIGNRIVEDPTEVGEYASLTTGYTLSDGTLEKLAVSFGSRLGSIYDNGIVDTELKEALVRNLPVLDRAIFDTFDPITDSIAATGTLETIVNRPATLAIIYDLQCNAYEGAWFSLSTKTCVWGKYNGEGDYSTNIDDYGYIKIWVNDDELKHYNLLSIENFAITIADLTLNESSWLTQKIISAVVDYKIYNKDDIVIMEGVVDAAPYANFELDENIAGEFHFNFSDLISTQFYDASYVEIKVITEIDYMGGTATPWTEETIYNGLTTLRSGETISPYLNGIVIREQTGISITSDFLVNKNFDETITIDWLLHHVQDKSLNDTIIIGDALTERSTTLNPELVDNNIIDSQFIYDYDRLVLCYRPFTWETYDIYNTGRLTLAEAGTVHDLDISIDPVNNTALTITNPSISITTPSGTSLSSYFKINNLITTDKSWMYAGEKTDSNGVKSYDMLFAVNKTPEEIYGLQDATNELYIYFTHLNLDVIYKY